MKEITSIELDKLKSIFSMHNAKEFRSYLTTLRSEYDIHSINLDDVLIDFFADKRETLNESIKTAEKTINDITESYKDYISPEGRVSVEKDNEESFRMVYGHECKQLERAKELRSIYRDIELILEYIHPFFYAGARENKFTYAGLLPEHYVFSGGAPLVQKISALYNKLLEADKMLTKNTSLIHDGYMVHESYSITDSTERSEIYGEVCDMGMKFHNWHIPDLLFFRSARIKQL